MNPYIWGRTRTSLGLGDDKESNHDRYEPTLLTKNTRDKIEWVHIECRGSHTVGLTKNGQVISWGRNECGQLGHGNRVDRSVPMKVKGLGGLVITKVSSSGTEHTAVLTDNGEMLTWGNGYGGQLGHNDRNTQLTPKKVEALADEVIVDVACGWRHTCAVTSKGSILTWGQSIATGHGEGTAVFKPKLLKDLSSKGVISVSASGSQTACVTKDGELFTWGYEEYGRLGHGDETHQENPKRVEALSGVKVTLVSCGENHTAVCTKDGHVYTCGKGECGQLGHGDTENKTSPVLVQALKGKNITQVQCGFRHTMALTSSGYVLTWGYAEYGRLGHGRLGHGNIKSKYLSIPCLVEGLRDHNVVQITSGYSYSAVLVDPATPSIIRESQQASFNNKLHSDIVLMVEQEPLYANVSVLSQKSDYFAAMFRSNMRESIERVVQVPNCSKAAFLLVLEYLYLDGFTISMDDVVELWELADFYQMEGLKYSCMGALERGLSEENASQILQEANGLSCPCNELKKMCHKYLR